MPLPALSHPWYLLLLPPLAGWVWYVCRHSLADLEGARRRWAMGLRLAIVIFAVLGLAGLQVRLPARRLAVLFVLDMSDSIPPDRKRWAIDMVNQAARRMGPRDAAGLVVFGGDAYLEKEADRALAVRQIHSDVPREYSNIAGALRLALAAMPQDAQKRVVLISDGNENLGDALEEATASNSEQVGIDIVPVQYEYPHEVLLEKLISPSEAKVGEPFEVRLIVRATEAGPGVVRLLRNGELIARQQVRLQVGPNAVTFRQMLEEARFHTYEAYVDTPRDRLPDNNRGLGFVLVKGKPRVLLVDNSPEDARYLAQALSGQKLQVDLRTPGRLPATLAEFQSYDSIILSNVGAYQLTPDQMKAIRSSVRDLGTGLVMVGGENSFGPGAYRGTPIEEALPVSMEVRKQKVMPVGAVAMVLHTCEFPDGNRWARETAAAVIDVLGERDKVGVLIYGMGEQWGIRMQPASGKEKLKAALYDLDPGDMPDFHRIVEMARYGLNQDAREASVKHIIVISDGDPSPPSPELMGRVRRDKITMSTVSVFPHGGGTGTLENMAADGKGQFYNVTTPDEIPRIFLKEAQRVLKPALIEETFTPKMLPGSELLQGIERVPPLMGYVSTTPKEAPGVEIALASHRDDPILVSWRYGLGRAVAFTSDARNRWAAAWLAGGSLFPRFWAQTIRSTVRSTARAALDTTVEIEQRKGRVTVDVIDDKGAFINRLNIEGSVAGEKVSPTLNVEQTGPGRYEGEFEAPERGQYMVALSYRDAGGVPRVHTVGAAVPYSPEYRDLEANTAVLTGLAERTGGVVHSPVAEKPHAESLDRFWRRDRRSHQAPQDLWPLLFALALLLLPIDIGVRRLNLSPSDWQEVGLLVRERTLGRFGARARRRGERDEGTGRLLGAKARASRRIAGEAPPEPPSTPRPAQPAKESPAAEAPSRPGVVWHRPVEGVQPEPPPQVQPPLPTAAPPPPPPPGSSTGRLLDAKRRSRERKE